MVQRELLCVLFDWFEWLSVKGRLACWAFVWGNIPDSFWVIYWNLKATNESYKYGREIAFFWEFYFLIARFERICSLLNIWFSLLTMIRCIKEMFFRRASKSHKFIGLEFPQICKLLLLVARYWLRIVSNGLRIVYIKLQD